MAGLTQSVVDIPLLTVNQTPADHMGPNGRLLEGKNIVVTNYVPGDGQLPAGGARINIKQRNGFTSLTTNATSPVDGSSVVLPWNNPGILAPLADQTLSIANSVPRVGGAGRAAWTGYSDKRSIPNRLEAGVYHTSNHTIQAPSDAWCNGTTCSVWTETLTGQSGAVTTVTMIGFRADDETWIIPPKVLYDPNQTVTDQQCMARVRTNGSQFFVAYNAFDLVDLVKVIRVKAYSTVGVELGLQQVAQKATAPSAGYWDIICTSDGRCQLVQPGSAPNGTTDVHVKFATFTYSGSLSVVEAADNTVHCSGPVAWMTNDLTSTHPYAYLMSHWQNHGIYCYQVEARAKTHEVATANPFDVPDTMVGWVSTGLVTDQPDFHTAFTLYAAAQTTGPKFDPACRQTNVYLTTWANSITHERRNNSVCLVSRAFKINDDYVAATYYQSGSGLTVTQNSQAVTWTSGDYMIGQPIQPVDLSSSGFVTGAVHSLLGQRVTVANAATAQNISAAGTPDQVLAVSASGLGVVPDGTPVLKWTLQNQPLGSFNMGGLLRVAGQTGIPSANGDWLLLQISTAGPTTTYYTLYTNEAHTTLVPGTFNTSGTAAVVSVTYYSINDLSTLFDNQTIQFLNGGSMVVTGQAVGANNGTKTIYLATFDRGSSVGYPGPTVSVLTGSEVTSTGGFTAELHPLNPDRWTIIQGHFSDAMATSGLDHFLTMGDDQFTVGTTTQNNVGSYKITSVTSSTVADTDGDNLVAQVFRAPLPTLTIDIADPTQAFKFKLQSLTLDYTFQNATVTVQDATNSDNNGTYKIIQINDDSTFYATPIDGHAKQTTESFANTVTITIFFSTNINNVFQPCFFLTPLEQRVKQAHVGRFEYLTAYADWRFEGEQTLPVNMFLLSVTDPVRATHGDPNQIDSWRFILPYRAQSFTAAQTLVTPAGQVVNSSTTIRQNTVGLKQFDILDEPGLALSQADELLLPGVMAGRFTSSGFAEDGVNVGPEQPYIISQSVSSDPVNLTPKTTHIYTFVFEVTDENGDRIYSIPSPPLSVTLVGTNNRVTLGIRQVQALDSIGGITDNVYGMSNHKLVGISGYRTSYENGTPTTQRLKITNDLVVNGLAPISTTNDSGFAFPDTFTATYIDANPDADILSGEILYTDKGYLPRFPAPAFANGCIWKNRPWVIGYDGSVWMGGERTEGDASWFFPAFRFDFADLRATQVQPMDEYLIVFCKDRSTWYIPAPNRLPDATGRNGELPVPVRLPMTNGCTGFAVPIRSGIAYSSTAGGVWLLRRDLTNVWLSQALQSVLDPSGIRVSGMTVDEAQRLLVTTNTSGGFVYDQVVDAWYQWALPTSSAKLCCTVGGRFHFQDQSRVARYDLGAFIDTMGASKFPTPPDFTLAPIQFGNVRGLKRAWEFQILGKYKGPHQINVVITYPDELSAVTDTLGPYTPNGSGPYLLQFSPESDEEASSYKLRIFADYDNLNSPDLAGDSFEIELLSASVGMDYRSGLNKTTKQIT